MTTVTPTVLYQGGQLAGAVALLFTARANTTATIITSATFTNADTGSHTFTVYVVRSGGTPGLANILIDAQSIGAKAAYVSPELQNVMLGPGDSIQAFADTGAEVTCSGINGYVVN